MSRRAWSSFNFSVCRSWHFLSMHLPRCTITRTLSSKRLLFGTEIRPMASFFTILDLENLRQSGIESSEVHDIFFLATCPIYLFKFPLFRKRGALRDAQRITERKESHAYGFEPTTVDHIKAFQNARVTVHDCKVAPLTSQTLASAIFSLSVWLSSRSNFNLGPSPPDSTNKNLSDQSI